MNTSQRFFFFFFFFFYNPDHRHFWEWEKSAYEEVLSEEIGIAH